MATNYDPNGVNSLFFNREGGVVLELTVEMGDNTATPTQIPTVAQKTIVNIAVNQTNAPFDQGGLILPVGADIGDFVELYGDGNNYRVTAPTGETINTGSSTRYPVPQATRCTKVSPTNWRFLI
jgi:hypothetical protein